MTDTDLEARLRAVLNADSARAPHSTMTVEQFLQRTDADVPVPRRRRSYKARWVAAAAAVVIGAGVGATVITNRGGGSAFASWVSRPQAISSAETAAVTRACSGAFVTGGTILVGGKPVTFDGPPVVIDRRGSTAYAIFSDGSTWSDCVTPIPGLPPDEGLRSSYLHFGGVRDVHSTAVGPGQPMVVLSAKAPEGNHVAAHPVTFVSGRVSSQVARVEVATSAGTVLATLVEGDFAAWWPGNDGDTAVVRAYAQSGRLLSTIDQLNCGVRNPVDPRIHVTGRAATGGCR